MRLVIITTDKNGDEQEHELTDFDGSIIVDDLETWNFDRPIARGFLMDVIAKNVERITNETT